MQSLKVAGEESHHRVAHNNLMVEIVTQQFLRSLDEDVSRKPHYCCLCA